jgi:hypothetical protein
VVVIESWTLEHGGDMNFTFEFGGLLKLSRVPLKFFRWLPDSQIVEKKSKKCQAA